MGFEDPPVLDAFRFLLIAVSGCRNQRQLQVIDYLREENRRRAPNPNRAGRRSGRKAVYRFRSPRSDCRSRPRGGGAARSRPASHSSAAIARGHARRGSDRRRARFDASGRRSGGNETKSRIHYIGEE
jgi:hypothetical protein